jgi:hypothetical protein
VTSFRVTSFKVIGFIVTGFTVVGLTESMLVTVWSPFIFQDNMMGKGKGVVSSF